MSAALPSELVESAVERVERRARAAAPFLADRLARWMRGLWPGRRPTDYFLQPDRFPFLALPWWLEAALAGTPDPRFQADLVYSSVQGYYFIRLVDGIMDGDPEAEVALLPALGFFHAEFQYAYQPWFGARHPFWDDFRALWYGAAEATARDAALEDIDRERFVAVSARKVSAARIPLAAVGHVHQAPERVAPWHSLCERLGRCEQLMDDVFDWHRDLERGGTSWFLCEARRRARPGESVAAWFVREGFEWGVASVREELARLRPLAADLGSPALVDHLERREARLLERRDRVRPTLRALEVVASAIGH